MLTKSDFLTFLDSPMHLWAAKHNQLDTCAPSDFAQIQMQQGYEVEKLAKQFIESVLLPRYPNAELKWQETFSDGDYTCRSDALIFDKECRVYDVYEIKSSTGVDAKKEYDLTYQTLIYESLVKVRNVHILHLNKEYVRNKGLDLESLFTITNLNDEVAKRKDEVRILRSEAWHVVNLESPDQIESCTKPKDCPCVSLCHSDNPKYPIYDLVGAKHSTILKYRDQGILSLTDIPSTARLNEKQEHQVNAIIKNQAYVDVSNINSELSQLTFPLYFLDYETFNSAIPPFDGYKPQQPLVFQYSLHRVDQGGAITHTDYLSLTRDDPAKPLAKKLSQEIGSTGSVLVWNKTFEMGRNNEMGERYSEFKSFFESVNTRIYDLADVVKKGYLIHPDFHGSWSIKSVLPVLVPRLSYKGMNVSKGDQAMATWWTLIQLLPQNGDTDAAWIVGSNEETVKDMLKYCELDTWAMVEIWRYLTKIESAPVSFSTNSLDKVTGQFG